MGNEVASKFSRAASTYDDYAEVQREAISQLMTLLPTSSEVSSILEVGCGTGLLTNELANRYPNSEIIAIDTAPGMISFSEQKFSGSYRITFVLADAQSYQVDRPVDLVVSSSTLHWFDDQRAALARQLESLVSGGIFAASFMSTGTFKELRQLKEKLFPRKAASASFPELKEISSHLAVLGCEVLCESEKVYPQRFSSSAEFFRALTLLGVTSGRLSRNHSLLSPGEVRTLIRDYQIEFGAKDEGVLATSHLGVVVAKK